jgi:hypothetical protein
MVKKPSNFERITEQEFLKILFESKKIALEDLCTARETYNFYVSLIIDTQTYKKLGYNVNYLFDKINGEIKYDIEERKIGFKSDVTK